jgi:hypothetical protein
VGFVAIGRGHATKQLVRVDEVDFCERTFCHPLFERPLTIWRRSAIESLNNVGENTATLSGIGNHGRDRRQIGHDAPLEVKREVRIGREIEKPISRSRSRATAQVRGLFKPIKADLESAGLTSASTDGGDIDRAIRKVWRISLSESQAYVLAHGSMLRRSVRRSTAKRPWRVHLAPPGRCPRWYWRGR